MNLNDQAYSNAHHSLRGKIFYRRCPDDSRYYRSIRLHFNPFVNKLVPQISNPVMGEPPEELQEIPPLLLSRIMRDQMSSEFF